MSFPIERIKLGVSPITNTIYIGRVNTKENMWLEKRDCTDEALVVVRDYLLAMCDNTQTTFGYEWTKKDGSIVELIVKVRQDQKESESID